jgi:putative tryptophan/tyrosine transport system substrate-binding protein
MRLDRLERREFIALLGGAATIARPLAARAQQPERTRTIGMIQALEASDPEAQLRAKAFQQRLQELGWNDGRNVRIDYRWAGSNADRIRSYAKEIISLKPDVIFAAGTPIVAALHEQTRAIPIVFAQVVDPVAAGFVASLGRPGGNVTGVTNFEFAVGGKWLEILKDLSPSLVRVAVIYNPKTAPYGRSLLRSIAAAGSSLAVEPLETPVHDIAEIDHAIDTFAQAPNGGLVVLPDTTTLAYRGRIIERAARHRLPAIYPFRYFVASGGLMSYGTDSIGAIRQATSYIDRILRGTKPEELPVQAPNKFNFVINLKTAKALGINVPPTLIVLADEVIE